MKIIKLNHAKWSISTAKTWISMGILTVSRLINLHLDRYFRGYSESSSDLIVPARRRVLLMGKHLRVADRVDTRNTNALNLTRAGRDQHCRTCRARGRTRGWPVDRSSRFTRWKETTPVPRTILAQPLIARRTASPNTMTCEHERFWALPDFSARSSHPEEPKIEEEPKSQRRRSSAIQERNCY